MANELIRVYGTEKTLEANGAACPYLSAVEANDATYKPELDGNSYPDAEFWLSAAFATYPVKGDTVLLCARELNIYGANHAQVPDNNRPGVVIGAFILDQTLNTQYMKIVGKDVPRDASYYLLNLCDYTMSTGWVLKVTPRTIKPAP